MQVPNETKMINETVLELRILALDPERYQYLNFEWNIEDFERDKWRLKLKFEKTVHVSTDMRSRD